MRQLVVWLRRGIRPVAGLMLLAPQFDSHVTTQDQTPVSESMLAALPAARIQVDSGQHTVVIELPPVDLPASDGHHEPMMMVAAHVAVLPADVIINAARVQVVDSAGGVLPRELLHHFNLTDPGRRELFLPISLHILAASRETPELSVPRVLLGLPLIRGQRLLAGGMLANTTTREIRGARIRLLMSYSSPGHMFPIYHAYPWAMDVMFPLGQRPGGSKAFDLPPGRSAHSWESQPAVAGRIVGLGGHVHDYAVSLELKDVTTNAVLYRGEPVRERSGRVVSMPVTTFYSWRGLGIRIVPEHRYRVTVVYDNPTGEVLADGGMGTVAGLFVPDRGVSWPRVDVTDSSYQADLFDTIHHHGMVMANHHMRP